MDNDLFRTIPRHNEIACYDGFLSLRGWQESSEMEGVNWLVKRCPKTLKWRVEDRGYSHISESSYSNAIFTIRQKHETIL